MAPRTHPAHLPCGPRISHSPQGCTIHSLSTAQIERGRIKERTMRGKRTRARQGFMVQGTGSGIYGYRYVPETKKRVVYEPEAHAVRGMFEDCASNKSCYSIATRLNDEGIPSMKGGLWHPLTVKRILTNPAFKGTTYSGRTRRIALGGKRQRTVERDEKDWIEIPDATPAIVTEALFDQVQGVLANPRRNPAKSSRKYLLTSYIECECGAPAVGTCLSKRYRYYRCRSTWPTSTHPKTCDASYIKAEDIEQQAWNAVADVLNQPDLVIQEIERQQGGQAVLERDMADTRVAIRRLADQEKRLLRLFGVDQVTEEYVLREVDIVKKVRESKERELGQLRQQRDQLMRIDGLSDNVRAFCEQVAVRLDGFDFDEKRLALEALQIKIVAGKSSARLRGAVPADLATIEQISASRRGRSCRCRLV